MQTYWWSQGQKVLQSFLALWLGVVLPLLCVPGMSSNHTHGLHWGWEQPGSGEQQSTSTHRHDHTHSHSDGANEIASYSNMPAPLVPSPSVPVGYPTISSNQIPDVEQLMNLFGTMESVPSRLLLTVIAGFIVLVSGVWLFRAVPPFAKPWHPPKRSTPDALATS